MRRCLRIFLPLLLTSICLGDGIVYLRLHRNLIEERLKLLPPTQQARLDTLRTMFKAAGCPPQQISQQPVHGQSLPNLICTLPGDGDGAIVVGASADYDVGDEQSKPNWASLVMLPLLVESLNAAPHRSTLAFVAFTGRDHGSQGASRYVEQMDKTHRSRVRAMVDLDSLGKDIPAYRLAQDDRSLATWLEIAATMLRLPRIPADLGRPSESSAWESSSKQPAPRMEMTSVSLGEAQPFKRAHIPAIGIQSAPSPDSAWDMQAYEQTYRLLCVYLLTLDHNLGKSDAAPSPSILASSTPPGGGTSSSAPAPSSSPSPAGGAATEPAASSATTQVATATPPSLSSADSAPVPVFHTSSRLVLVDVTVRDKQGNPVKDLKASDFTVSENAVPQQIRVFEPHGAFRTPQPQPAPPSLPPHTFTNRATVPPDDVLSVLMLDLLNTPLRDQMYARAQMLKFLRALPPGRHIALFVLGTRLVALQGFTQSSEALVKATEKIVASDPMLLRTETDREESEGENDFAAVLARPHSPMPQAQQALSQAINENNMDLAHARSRNRAEVTTAAIRTGQRVRMTLAALNAISQSVAVYPGRKNLVWLSGSFPIELKPVAPSLGELTRSAGRESAINQLNATADFQPEVRLATAMLAAARVAVYPVDVRGMRTSGLDLANSNGDILTGPREGEVNGYGQLFNDQSEDRFQSAAAMNDIARQTGGEAVVGSNDIRGAIARSIDDGSNYYTLAYSPEAEQSDNLFRKIEVRLDRNDVELAYRRGYYPKPKGAPAPESSVHSLAAAMMPETPLSTMLLLTAQVLPPDESHKQARLDYKIDLAGVEFTDAPDQRKQALLDCMAIAFDKDGKDVGHVANTIGITLNPAEYEAMLRNGVPMHQEMALPAGTYQLRIGVMDRLSQKVGTVDAPLTVTEQKAASN
jgi:VWFA-related protein